MKYKSILPALFFLFGFSGLFAQVIIADTTSGCNALKVQFRLEPSVSVGTNLTWDFGNGIIMGGNLFSPLVYYNSPGKYTVTCRINNSFTITATNLITIYKSPSSHFVYNDSLEINSLTYSFRYLRLPEDTGSIGLNWQFSDGGTGSNPSVIHAFPGTGKYFVQLIASSSNGCSDTTKQLIAIANLLEVPNVFTPNNDAINDVFIVRTDGIHLYTFSVYTRSGVLVYKSEAPDISWDGRSFAGDLLTQGLYYFTIEQKAEAPVTELKGIVYLLR